ncbi:MAG: glycosyltransferase family 2 protein [Ruminiclostridium sp.]|nr:glycosyltransferase family 2 protein [Ruminiclostridium sp.]
MRNILYIVVPCYNEEAVLPETSKRLLEKYKELTEEKLISEESRIVFVNDGSKDSTWEIISRLHDENIIFSGINLSKNKGHQNAVMAGLMTVKDRCDIAITLDADLQDDINAIDEMVKKYHSGNDVVYGVRSSRKTDTFFKRFTAESFYKFMKIMGVDVVFNHADFRLMSNRVLDALSEYKEFNLFLRGIIPQIGFKSDCVYYERHERFAGESKYPLKKMLSFAVDGITSFSVKPLKIIANTGIIISALSIIAFFWVFIGHFVSNSATALGWPSIMCSIWFLGGLQIFFLGIIGEYIGKIYSEAKGRPRYVIQSELFDDNDKI